MTRRKASIARAKHQAYVTSGTCAKCGRSIVAPPAFRVEGTGRATGRAVRVERERAELAARFCRSCRPDALEEAERNAKQLAEGTQALELFKYFLIVRKKDQGVIGKVARAVLPKIARLQLRGVVSGLPVGFAALERELDGELTADELVTAYNAMSKG